MFVKGTFRRGEYHDSVTLMTIAKHVSATAGILDAAVVMGTKENKSILSASGLLLPEFQRAGDQDLLICVKAVHEKAADRALLEADERLKKIRQKEEKDGAFAPRSIDGALRQLPDANLALISVPGKYATEEALKALQKNLHVMIFSDEVPLEKEIELKRYAIVKELIVMGPACSAAIINGVPLAFANTVNHGNIGVIAASANGLQEMTCICSNQGAGISQAIGTGERDIIAEVGGTMVLESLKALGNDPETKVLVLVSKPPHEEVLEKIVEMSKSISKPLVSVLLGMDHESMKKRGMIAAETIEEGALLAVQYSKGSEISKAQETLQEMFQKRKQEFLDIAKSETAKLKSTQRYIRGFFSAGTLCSEAQVILRNNLPVVIQEGFSNIPMAPFRKMKDPRKSEGHVLIDLGENEFTVGRLHPMLDYSLRNHRIIEEARKEDVALLLLDVVLGHGSIAAPADELAPVIRRAKEISNDNGRYLPVICSITGTNHDPQNRSVTAAKLKEAGAMVMPTNAAACELAATIAAAAGGRQ